MTKPEIVDLICKQYLDLPDNCKRELLEMGRLIEVSKKEKLVEANALNDQMFFIARGGVRAYYLKNEQDISDWFAFENEFICAIQSFFNNIPSPHYIESLEDSLLFVLSRQQIMTLSEKYRSFERVGNLATTRTMLKLQERIVSLQFETANQKYINLLQEIPDIELRVSIGNIASYLGITIETLSRIRAKKSKVKGAE